MKIAVSVESTNDLTQRLLNRYEISSIPFEIVLKDRTFKDGEMTIQELFDYVDQNGVLPKTNALNEFEYTEYFTELLKKADAVVHIALSSGISSSCSNAERAAKALNNVYVVDSKSLSTGIGLLAIHARELAEQGVAPDKIKEILEQRREKLQVSFVIERLDYLYKGGRCNALSLLGANLLKIRPRIVVKEGKMGSDKKYRGTMDKVVAKYCQETLAEFDTPDLDKVFITYTTATEGMVNAAKEALVEAGFKNIYETNAGCTVSSHCGGNTLGILYFNDGVKE